MGPKEVVRRGYDVVSFAYRRDDEVDGVYAEWLEELSSRMPEGADVLDLGCGYDVPTDRWLAAHGFHVLGVDLSPVQIDRARKLVPGARYMCADMTTLDLPERSMDAVVALYSLIHVPIGEQRPLLASISAWLRPGGYLLTIVGAEPWTGTLNNWLGAGGAMYWSHEGADTYRSWLLEAGFELESDRFIAEDDGGHQLFLARLQDPS
jgi:SAM-dependent methyltransferase